MIIKKLTVANVRSHIDRQIELSSGVTVITGKNGIGKTTLLEAIYIALQGKSFKGVDRELIRTDAPWYRIDLLIDDGDVRTVTYDPSKSSGNKRFTIDDKYSYRLQERNKYPVVLFEPEDLRLLHGSPSRRRAFIDGFIAQIDPQYGAVLRKYERALKQRNALLKAGNLVPEDLFAWNIALSEYGATIIQRRQWALEMINDTIESNYHELARTSDKITVKYSYTGGQSASALVRELEESFSYDTAVKFTSIGPHRHDILFYFNENLATAVASRGEVRTILLALKRIEIDVIYRKTGKRPTILLDDVFSELDGDRQGFIVDYFSNNQVVISSATKHTYDNFTHIEL